MARKSSLRTIIIMLLIAGAIVAIYFAVSRGNENATIVESAAVEGEVNKLIGKDIAKDYPYTPREVVKLYSRMLKCFYGEDMTEDEIADMVEQLRILYDSELLANNLLEDQVSSIKSDIADYRLKDRTIMSYTIEKADNVKMSKVDGVDYATIFAYYTIKESTAYTRSYEEFILRKDSAGEWKILGWREAEKEDMEED